MAVEHAWTWEDDIVAFYLSRFHGVRFLGIGLSSIVKILNERPRADGHPNVPMREVSLNMRIQNFDFLDGKPGGLSIAAKQSRSVRAQYSSSTIVEMHTVVIQILGITISTKVKRSFEEFCRKYLNSKQGRN